MSTRHPHRGAERPVDLSPPACDRREFLGAAAALPAALAAAGICGADVPAAKAPPAEAPKMSLITLGKYSLSRLIVGCHNIDGGSHTSPFMEQTRRPCLAFKILAAGRRTDVEQAFRETFAAIKPTDAVIVGIYDRYSDQAGQNAEFVRRFGSRS
jgi:hypothetical protein